MKVLMFGWEFPPVYSGGLGTACHGLTKGLVNQGVAVTFVMPKGPPDIDGGHVKLLVADNLKIENLKITKVESLLLPYLTSGSYESRYRAWTKTSPEAPGALYGKDIYHEVWRFGEKAKLIAMDEPDVDVIHAHDWMTYPAGINAKEATGKPLVVHIHATEFDRTGFNSINQYVYDIERKGLHAADRVIAVSEYTKNVVTTHYGVPPDKVTVVHNAVDFSDVPNVQRIPKSDKIVLFLGRITLQKGPDYFVRAAKRVLDIDPNVTFIMAGSGDMTNRMIEMSSHLGIASKMLFAGFLTGKDIDHAYRMADVFVMPSVSEPFGITPLEAMRNGTPVIISKQSGVSEVIRHCLKVDFWDIDDMADKILTTLRYGSLHGQLKDSGLEEVRTFNWSVPAQKCKNVYEQVMAW
ncbi:MAG: glycosyltransferase family 4 protein [Nanoarchaeota archaeon]